MRYSDNLLHELLTDAAFAQSTASRMELRKTCGKSDFCAALTVTAAAANPSLSHITTLYLLPTTQIE
jgi:hypothetical protein